MFDSKSVDILKWSPTIRPTEILATSEGLLLRWFFSESVAYMERRVGPVGGIWKRSFDCAAAFAALMIMSPIMLVIALLILLAMGRPIFTAQRSVGFNRSFFTRLTFKTVISAATIADHRDVTWLGNILRESGLDELPQLFNILCGHMSFVGPQCLPVSELVAYCADVRHYAKARPGLTGLGQMGLSKNSIHSSDCYYAQCWSPALDVFILTRTALGICRPRDTAFTRNSMANHRLGIWRSANARLDSHCARFEGTPKRSV